jgi:hypothetical protein
MPSRSPLIALLILLALPAAAHATDPLLSGYGGPGGGEQVVLGGGPVGGGGAGSGGARAAATGAESLRASSDGRGPGSALAPGAPAKLTDKPQKRKSPSSAASQQKTMPNGTTTSTKTVPIGAPQAVAYPTRAGAVSGLPISAGGVLGLVAAIALFVLAALGLRHLSVGSEDAPRRPQVSSS